MATVWVVTNGMLHFRNSVNEIGPSRDRASDGSIGDLAHQNEAASGHNPDRTGRAEWKDGDSKNEVRALDIDNSGPWLPGITTEKWVQHLVQLGRTSDLEKVIRYIIYNKRIWAASDGWKTRAYTGPSPHTEHVHVSGAYSQASDENTTYNYRFMEMVTDMAFTATDLADMRRAAFLGVYDAGQSFLHATTGNAADATAEERALRTGWAKIVQFGQAQAIADEATRDAAQSAKIDALLAAITAISSGGGSSTGGVLSDEQFNILVQQMDQAGAAAGAAATERMEGKLDALRAHLGDDEVFEPVEGPAPTVASAHQ